MNKLAVKGLSKSDGSAKFGGGMKKETSNIVSNSVGKKTKTIKVKKMK